jgi:hypothetical protein
MKAPLLIMLLQLVDQIPLPPPPEKRPRGRQRTYSDRLMVKALVVMVIRRLYTAYRRLAFPEQETELTIALRTHLREQGRFPTRRTWERRLTSLPALIGCLGRHLVELLQPWGSEGKAAAIDRTPLCAKGGVWHKKDREAGVVPHSTIDTQAHWSKSGYHGWWYGWKLHLVSTTASLCILLAASLTPANVTDEAMAPALIRPLHPEIAFLLGDTHYNEPTVRLACEQSGRFLVATHRGKPAKGDSGAPVRQLFHRLRSKAIEPFNAVTIQAASNWTGACRTHMVRL